MMNNIDFPMLFQQNKNIFIIMGLVCAACLVYGIIRIGIMKSSNRRFLLEHDDLAKVYLIVKALITSEVVTVYTVDDEKPEFFMEGGKSGFYAIPGQRLVEVSYTYSRPGILHKNVTTSFGPVKKELIIAPNKKYQLGFDREKEAFTFDEL
jgi:hypothetical protein